MSASIGRRDLFAMGREEAAVGTLSTQLVSFPFDSLSDTFTKNVIENTQAHGRIEAQKEGSEIGSKMGEVTFSGFLPTVNVGQLLKALFGTLNTSVDTPVAGANTHTFTVENTNEGDSYSLVWQDPVRKQQMLGARASSCTITTTTEDWSRYEITFMGKFPGVSVASIPAFLEKPNWTTCQAEFKVGNTLATLGSAIGATNVELTFERSAEAHYAFGDCDVDRIITGPWQISASVETLWDAATLDDLFTAHTQQALQLKFTTDEFITGTTPYDLEIKINAGTFRTSDVNRDLDSKQMVTLEFTGEYDVGETSMASAVLINDADNTDY